MAKLLGTLRKFTTEQESIRKINISIAEAVDKKKNKIAICKEQIDLLTQSLKDLNGKYLCIKY